jgi:hypothetical protein
MVCFKNDVVKYRKFIPFLKGSIANPPLRVKPDCSGICVQLSQRFFVFEPVERSDALDQRGWKAIAGAERISYGKVQSSGFHDYRFGGVLNAKP